MFEDFDARNNQEQEDEEDSETLSYSYPSYSRFTYTGKTKSRLGRSRFMRQSGNKDETKKPDDDSSGISDLKPNTHFLQSNSQAPKTPGVSWLQRDSSAHPFTPGGKSTNVHGSCSGLGPLPSQSNFLFNLKNDSVQNSSCKRNLPFSTTPFKTKEVPVDSQSTKNPLRELNQLLKPENPFSQLDFFSRPKEEKENSGKTKTENVKNNDLEPPAWNQLKRICDAIPLPASIPETNKVVSIHDLSDLKTNESAKSSLFVPFSAERKDENKRDDDSSTNMPLDLSSAESTARTLFSRSLMSGDHLDGDSSDPLNHQLKDSTRESIVKADDSTTQKTNTDALSGFLPRFLVPKNKNNKTEFPDDVSAHSVGTVVERMFDVQPQTPFQKSQMSSQAPTKMQMTSTENHGIEVTGNEVYSSSQYKSALNNDMKKYSPPSLPINFTYKDPSPSSLPDTNNQFQSVFQPQLHHNPNQKSSPPSVPSSVISSDPPKLSPPSANSVPDFRNLVNNGQHILKQEQNHHLQHKMKNENEINSSTQNVDDKLGIVSKSYANNQEIPDVNQLKNKNVPLSSANEICPSNQFKPDIKPADLINPLINNQQKLLSSNQIQISSESLNSLYCGVRHEPRRLAQLDSGERNLNQLSVQQPNVVPKPVMIDQRDPVLYTRPQENIQPSLFNQKTYLAPQQPPDRNSAGDFPHLKPEIPLPGGSKPSLPAMKRPSQFKMSAARGMPSRADTELSVNGKSYGILSMLGKGGSSEVYQVLDSGTSKLLAVKCVDLSMVDKTIADGYLNEIDLLSRLQGCTSVIRMFEYEYVQECKMLYVVMEKGDTDLSHLIRDISKTKKISMSMIIYYWTEMLQAVKDIHDQGIIHSDLKPANFLLVSGRLKLIDFGIASSQGDMTSVVKEVTTGTWNYMSPEAIKNTSASGKGFKITYKSDVWSLGCILYNLVYGKTPFSHITNTWGKLTAIADPNHCIEFPDVGAPAVLVKALRSCFHREPKLRPTVAELLSLPYHSTGDGSDLSSLGRQVQTILPAQWWLRVAHLFPGVKPNQEGKTADNAG